MTKTVVLIDGDVVAYRCAAANETRSIKVTHKVTGQITSHAHRTAFKEHIKDCFEIDEFDIEDVREARKLNFAIHGINTTIEALKKSCKADEVEVHISGKTNFRDSLPLPSKYKGAREGLDKPVQLKECRDHLVTKYNATAAIDKEADDTLTQRAYELYKQGYRGIVATIDKDAYGTEVWLYNWTKMTEPIRIKGLGFIELDDKKVLRGQGRKWFYCQWAKGDIVDNFKPCEIAGKKFGDISCYNLLKDCNTDKECVEAVYKQYKSWYPDSVTYTAWNGIEYTKDVVEIMDMYAACAHMKRWDDDVFNTKNLLEKFNII